MAGTIINDWQPEYTGKKVTVMRCHSRGFDIACETSNACKVKGICDSIGMVLLRHITSVLAL